jgi:hypothetical protein
MHIIYSRAERNKRRGGKGNVEVMPKERSELSGLYFPNKAD